MQQLAFRELDMQPLWFRQLQLVSYLGMVHGSQYVPWPLVQLRAPMELHMQFCGCVDFDTGAQSSGSMMWLSLAMQGRCSCRPSVSCTCSCSDGRQQCAVWAWSGVLKGQRMLEAVCLVL